MHRRSWFAIGLASFACAIAGATWLDWKTGRGPASGRPADLHGTVSNGHGSLDSEMRQMARRFASLWFAARSGDRGSAQHELNRIAGIAERVKALDPRPRDVLVGLELHDLVDAELTRIAKSIETGNITLFESLYRRVLRSCNSCHRRTGFGFVRIGVPVRPPSVNRIYEPSPGAGKSSTAEAR